MEIRFSHGCFWAFSLLSVSLILQVGMLILALLKVPTDPPQRPKAPPLVESLASLLGASLTMLPAAVLFYQLAISKRWKQAAIAFFFAVASSIRSFRSPRVVVGFPAQELAQPEPIIVRFLLAAASLCTWVEFWWIVVLIAEFGIVCRPRGFDSQH